MNQDNTQTYEEQGYQPQKTSGLAIASLVLGIAGIACLGIFAGLPAVICGHMAIGSINRSQGAEAGKGMAIAGLITGYFATVVTLLVIVAFLTLSATPSTPIR